MQWCNLNTQQKQGCQQRYATLFLGVLQHPVLSIQQQRGRPDTFYYVDDLNVYLVLCNNVCATHVSTQCVHCVVMSHANLNPTNLCGKLFQALAKNYICKMWPGVWMILRPFFANLSKCLGPGCLQKRKMFHALFWNKNPLAKFVPSPTPTSIYLCKQTLAPVKSSRPSS